MLANCSNEFDRLINEILFTKEHLNHLKRARGLDSREGIHLKNSFFLSFMLIRRDYRNQIFATLTHFALRMVS